MLSIIAVIFGIVQGLTEFIPVSSSGHLLLLHKLFPQFVLQDEVGFDVALHIGTLAALLAVFWRDCFVYIQAVFVQPSTPEETMNRRVAWHIILAIIPAGLAGLLFEHIIDTHLRSPLIVVCMLIIVALLFFVIEAMPKEKFRTSMNEMKWKQALAIGLAQMLALIPGTSRSGITMAAGMATGLKRDQAARFSFLIAIPIIAAAGLKKMIDMLSAGIATAEIPLFLIGMVSSAVVGYLAIQFLLKFLSTNTLRPFAVYRILLALIVLAIFYI
ncbi:MAG: undecaprenyl-diphosphatase UppP [Candidatus Kerfeldbacteria bacterium]|nr:undecaprenyl-diphosphatase UppP [Candidatus Kerfeldbacteria bacterium]